MPNLCINAWQIIWSLTDSQLGGKRQYQADFEIYHTIDNDPEKLMLEVYIGIKQQYE